LIVCCEAAINDGKEAFHVYYCYFAWNWVAGLFIATATTGDSTAVATLTVE